MLRLFSEYRVVIFVVLGLIALLSLVDRYRYSERNTYWQNKIANTPVLIDTQYVPIKVESVLPRQGSKPATFVQPTENWRVRVDSLIIAAEDTVGKLQELIRDLSRPIETVFEDSLLVETPKKFAIPYHLYIRSDNLDQAIRYVLEPQPFLFPSTTIKESKIVLQERAWYEFPLIGLAIVVAFLIGNGI